MARISVPYEKIDILMGVPKHHENKRDAFNDKNRAALRKKFLQMYIQAICPSIKDAFQSITDDINNKAFNIQVWAEKDALVVFTKLLNFDNELIYFPLSVGNIEAHVDWLQKHCTPEKFEITTLMGTDLCIIFRNTDDAMRFKLSYDPTQK